MFFVADLAGAASWAAAPDVFSMRASSGGICATPEAARSFSPSLRLNPHSSRQRSSRARLVRGSDRMGILEAAHALPLVDDASCTGICRHRGVSLPRLESPRLGSASGRLL